MIALVDHARRFGCKQFVACVENSLGGQFLVFTCGDDKFYLFQPIDKHGCATLQAFPVLRKNLRDDIRLALRHGFGNSYIGKPLATVRERQKLMSDGAGI